MKLKTLALLLTLPLAFLVQDGGDEGRRGPKPPAVGDAAPAFRLNDHEGRAAAVGGANPDGRWTIVAFYPKALTPG